MPKALNRHIHEIIMILIELLISVLLMLQVPSVVEVISVCVGIFSMLYGVYCIINYIRTLPTYLRYDPELYRGTILLFVGAVIASMQKWFTVTTSHPAVAFGLILLMVAVFKTAIVYNAMISKVPHLLIPSLSTLFTFALSVLSMFMSFVYFSSHWTLISAFMIAILLVDAFELVASETKKREPWSIQIRCWM